MLPYTAAFYSLRLQYRQGQIINLWISLCTLLRLLLSLLPSYSMLSLTMALAQLPVSNMLNKLHGQPESYDKKYDRCRPSLTITH